MKRFYIFFFPLFLPFFQQEGQGFTDSFSVSRLMVDPPNGSIRPGSRTRTDRLPTVQSDEIITNPTQLAPHAPPIPKRVPIPRLSPCHVAGRANSREVDMRPIIGADSEADYSESERERERERDQFLWASKENIYYLDLEGKRKGRRYKGRICEERLAQPI